MKKKLRNKLPEMQNAIMATMLLLILFGACTNKKHDQHDEYTCAMHPTIVKNKPGTCPICGMDLVLRSQYVEDSLYENISASLQSPNRAVISSVKTVTLKKMSMQVEVKGQGIVTYDTRDIHDITARFGGRIEKVYVKSPFQKISKGDRIASVYSPEIINAEENLLYLLKNDPDNIGLIASARQKLSLLGLSQNQIGEIVQSGNTSGEIMIYSDHDGYAMVETQTSSDRAADALSENKMSSDQIAADMQSSFMREGNYIRTGQILFRLISTKNVRLEINLPLSDASVLKAGNDISVSINDEHLQTHVSLVQPFTNASENFLKVRVDLPNKSQWRPGQLVNASVTLPSKEGYWLPEGAVVNTGLNEIVFVKQNDVFVPKRITTGIHDNDFVLVNNLDENEVVAADAQFMVDSESFIKTSN